MMTEPVAVLFATPWGWCGLAGGSSGLQRVYLPVPDRSALRETMERQFPGAAFVRGAFDRAAGQLRRYFRGERPCFDCRLDVAGASAFQQRVWLAARRIPYGQVRTYGWVARAAGSPQAMRAVGSALGRNPLPIIIPCHRVIRADGGLGGFSAPRGPGLKQQLLQLEGVPGRKTRSGR